MTNLVRFNPTTEFRRLQQEIDRLFDGATTNGHDDDRYSAVWSPRVDLAESDEAYEIYLDVPGMTKDDLEINFHEGTLTVRGERKQLHREEDTKFVRVERRYGQFYRSFTLPKAIITDDISAAYDNGVLTITVPKQEEMKPRRISVA